MEAPNGKSRVLLDTDANNELDDQHAIAYLLFNDDVFDVAGITINKTEHGGDIDDHAREAERVVELCGMGGEVPIVKGASGSFDEIAPHLDEQDFDGHEAVDFIIEKVYEDERKLVLIPIGKLTNIALALKKDPSIAARVRIVWLGSNYPDKGEYNLDNDPGAVRFLLNADVAFEIVVVRYGDPSGTDAVRVTPDVVKERMSGKGPRVEKGVEGRNGGSFNTFGDYSVDLFENIDLFDDPPSRALYDMVAVAVVKEPAWGTRVKVPAPDLVDGKWDDRPHNSREILVWQHFNRDAIIEDFFRTMEHPFPARRRPVERH